MSGTILTAALLAVAAQGNPGNGPLSSACNLRIESMTDWTIDNYDPFGRSLATAPVNVTFTNNGVADCRFVPTIAIDRDQPGLRGADGRRIAYSVTAMNGPTTISVNGVDNANNGGGNDRIELKPNESRTLVYSFTVTGAGDAASDGLYSQEVELRARGQGQTVLAALPVTVGLDVMPSATLSLAGSYQLVGNQALVSLGEIERGKVKAPLQLHVRSTRRYRLTVDSENRGALKSLEGDWSVDYAMSIGGRDLSLAGGVTPVDPPGPNGFSREALPIRFTITGDPAGKRAGTYRDVVTISVAPL